MIFFPKDIKSRIEFDKVLERLAEYCLSDVAKDRALKLSLFKNKKHIDSVLNEVSEYKQSIMEHRQLPLFHFEDIHLDIPLLMKEGYVLDIEAIFRIQRVIQMIDGISVHFTDAEHRESFPSLSNIADQIFLDKNITSLIDAVFEPDGQIKPSASPELRKIIKEIQSKEKASHNAFNQVIKQLKSSGALSENGESFKNGRRVLSINAGQKRKVNGIIHDESASGKTVFIEPEEVVFLNNQVFQLELKKKQEIYKILKKLCDDLRPYADTLLLWIKILIRFDLIRAKAQFAVTYKGSKPIIEQNSKLKLVNAFHPLLYIKNAELNLKTVPCSLELDNDNRILLISGPNAGGKSITLKTVALCVFMTQAGLLPPLSDLSEVGVFHNFFVDIGDQQSVEDDLSTYSSHLTNMKAMLSQSNKRSFVFIDEFGSGTDPKIGGSISEIILSELRKKKVFGVITTHYSNLKMYAHNTKGILNAAMQFDHKELKPIYELVIGKPGSSFAFEIAKKIGLPDEIINRAQNKFGNQEKEVESLLSELLSDKKDLESKLDDLEKQKRSLELLQSNYKRMNKDLEIRRKRLKLTQKERELKDTADTQKSVQKLINELKKDIDLEKAKNLISELREKKSVIQEDIAPLKEAIYESTVDPKFDPKLGDYVKLKQGGEVAQIIKMSKNKVEVQMGILKMTVSHMDIMPADKPISTNATKSIKYDLIQNTTGIETKLDIRGYIPSDARDFLVEFFDQALITNQSRLEIVHGKGTGVLRKLVKEVIKDYKSVKKVWNPQEEFGGKAVTFVEF